MLRGGGHDRTARSGPGPHDLRDEPSLHKRRLKINCQKLNEHGLPLHLDATVSFMPVDTGLDSRKIKLRACAARPPERLFLIKSESIRYVCCAWNLCTGKC